MKISSSTFNRLISYHNEKAGQTPRNRKLFLLIGKFSYQHGPALFALRLEAVCVISVRRARPEERNWMKAGEVDEKI